MKKITTISALLLFTLVLNAQYIYNVMVSDEYAPEEPSITMNPKNPMLLMAGANLHSYYHSTDGGVNWTRGDLISYQNGVYGDPCLFTDTAGNFYYVHLANPSNGNWLDRIVCQRYDNNTNTWNDGSYMGLNGDKDQDKAWAVVDSATNTIYVTWTQFDDYGNSDPNMFTNIMFSKSTDMGDTWSPAVSINEVPGDCIDSDNTVEGAVPAVGPSGEIYVAWAGPAGIVFDRSLDGGQTWLDNDIFVSDQPGGWDYNVPGIYRCNGLSVTCCDVSRSPYRGTIYVNWTDQRNGTDDTDVWLAKSTDGGNTWSDPIRVNDDAPGRQQFFSWMTIDGANGDIYIVFYDRRNYIDNHTDVYLARSVDGGETFQNTKLNDDPFNPVSQVFFGDYTNITAYGRQVHAIWTRADITNLSVWVTNVDFMVGTAENVVPEKSIIYPNPAKNIVNIEFSLKTDSKVSAKLIDMYGKTIAVLFSNKNFNAGTHKETFDINGFNLTPGIYYVSTNFNNVICKNKLIVE